MTEAASKLRIAAKAAGAVLLIAVGVVAIVYYRQLEAFFLNAPPAFRWLVIAALCFIGDISVLAPVPYTALLLLISTRFPSISPLEVALWGGLGAALGEVTSWILGRLMSGAVEKRYSGKVRALRAAMERHKILVPALVFIFAFTPLPDDALFIALGTLRYSLLKSLVPCFLGKACMLLVITCFGSWLGSELEGGLGSVAAVALTLALIALFYLAVALIDWEKLLYRYLEEESGKRVG